MELILLTPSPGISPRLAYFSGGDKHGERGDKPMDKEWVKEGTRLPNDKAEGGASKEGGQRFQFGFVQMHEGKRYGLQPDGRSWPKNGRQAEQHKTSPHKFPPEEIYGGYID